MQPAQRAPQPTFLHAGLAGAGLAGACERGSEHACVSVAAAKSMCAQWMYANRCIAVAPQISAFPPLTSALPSALGDTLGSLPLAPSPLMAVSPLLGSEPAPSPDAQLWDASSFADERTTPSPFVASLLELGTAASVADAVPAGATLAPAACVLVPPGGDLRACAKVSAPLLLLLPASALAIAPFTIADHPDSFLGAGAAPDSGCKGADRHAHNYGHAEPPSHACQISAAA